MSIVERPSIQVQQRIHAYGLFVAQVAALMWVVAELSVGRVAGPELGLFLVCTAVNLIGVEVGMHRFFSHKAFVAKKPLKLFLGVAALSAGQGPILYWVANHRRHHARSDKGGDVHSPHHGPPEGASLLRRWWHAHQGWIVSHDLTDTVKYARELYSDRLILQLNRFYLSVLVTSLLAPGVFLFLLEGTGSAFVSGVFWGGIVRLAVALNITFATNSVCHLFGSRRFETPDQSRNNLWLNCLSWGGGLHNNHHANPTLASCSFRWWEVDAYGWLISTFALLGLASNVRRKRTNA